MSSEIAKLLPRQNFDFVGDSKLQEILKRDYQELCDITKVKASKSTVVMCGSIIEAILVAKLLTPESQQKYLEKTKGPLLMEDVQGKYAGLDKLIKMAVIVGFLDKGIEKEVHVVQDYRNAIHPAKETRGELKIDHNLMISIIGLFNRVVEQLAGPKASITKLTPRERFLKKLDKTRGATEVKIAKEIMAWAANNGLQDRFTSTLTYAPRLYTNGNIYTPLILKPHGKFEIPFKSFIKKPSKFRLSQNREVLRKRLNLEALGDRIAAKRINGTASAHLKILANETNLKNFLMIFDWVVVSIKE